jgi:ribosome recycling factor
MSDADRLPLDARLARAIEAMERDFGAIRTGRASTSLVERIQVEYYGTFTPINQLASISVPEAHQIVIQPWDRGALGAVEKAILKSDLGLMPKVDGVAVRLNIPPLTEERRRDLVKQAKSKGEDAKVTVRNVRRKAMEELARIKKDGEAGEDEVGRAEKDLDKSTATYTGQIDELVKNKEGELLEV